MTAADTHTNAPIETHAVVTPVRIGAENLQRLGEPREFVHSTQSFRNWQLRANEARGRR